MGSTILYMSDPELYKNEYQAQQSNSIYENISFSVLDRAVM